MHASLQNMNHSVTVFLESLSSCMTSEWVKPWDQRYTNSNTVSSLIFASTSQELWRMLTFTSFTLYVILDLVTVWIRRHLHIKRSLLSFISFRSIGWPHPPCLFPSTKGPGQDIDECRTFCICMNFTVICLECVMLRRRSLKLKYKEYCYWIFT